MVVDTPVARKDVFPDRIAKEDQDFEELVVFMNSELTKAAAAHKGDEPNFVKIEIDRNSPDGADRYTEAVLGRLKELYGSSGWLDLANSLRGNKIQKIVLWFK